MTEIKSREEIITALAGMLMQFEAEQADRERWESEEV